MVKTGVWVAVLLWPFLFLLAIDWIMKKTTQNRRTGIQWTPWSQLEDLDFADDFALLSHSHQQKQEKNRAAKQSVNTGRSRTQHQQKQCKDYESQHKEQQPHHIERRAKRGKINKNGGTEEDIKARIQKARVPFIKIWRAKQIKIKTNLRKFNSNVKAILLYGLETWRSTQKTLKRIQTFINKCLHRILYLKWTDKVSNTTLWKMTK